MKKLITIILLVLFSTLIKAQNWCPQGAEWYFTRYYSSGSAYAKHTFTGTLTINNLPCQQINYYSQYYSGISNSVNSYSLNLYTYFNNNIVYLLDANSNNFDTLFNYNAIIGSKWSLPNKSSQNCSNSRVLVTDTGHHVIQGVNLKWFKVTISEYQYSNPNPNTVNDTIYERIGCLSNYMYGSEDVCASHTDSEMGGPLRCYSDFQISSYKKYSGNCNYFYIPTGINENTKDNVLSFFPSPADNTITLNLIVDDFKSGSAKYKILNQLGQVISDEEVMFKDKNVSINTSRLANGVYILKLTMNENSVNVSKRFVIAR